MSVTDGGDDSGKQPDDPGADPAAADRPVPGYKQKSVWLRGLFMVLFLIFFEIGEWLLGAVAVLQFLWLLFDREPNDHIRRFGQSLSIWLRDTARFQSCETDDKPFPWAPWPKPE